MEKVLSEMNKIELKNIKKIHFTGIGGSGMSVLAEAFLESGVEVTGSDVAAGKRIDQLRNKGVKISVPHSDEYLFGAELLCYSSAVNEGNIERKAALRNSIPQIKRGDLLAELLQNKEVIGIAGSHGKTTTTGFMVDLLFELERPVSLMLGGLLCDEEKQKKVAWGKKTVVAETDESDGTFLKVKPEYGIITNIDKEHLAYYGSFENLVKAFEEYFMSIKEMPVVNGDDPVIRDMIDKCNRSCITYGFSSENNVWACELEQDGFKTSFDLVCNGAPSGRFSVNLIGRYNVLNALAVISMGVVLGYSLDKIRKALLAFKGVRRRMEIRKQVGEVFFVDDYAHHPTEIKAALKAVKQCVKESDRLVTIVQPHRYSRVKECLEDFAQCFDSADLVIVTDIYGASEKNVDDINSKILFDKIFESYGEKVCYLERYGLAENILPLVKKRDYVIFLGAGDITIVLDELAQKYGEIINET